MEKDGYGNEALQDAVQQFNQLYEKGDARWFELFDDDAMIFSVDSAEPIRGRSAYQKQLGSRLGGRKTHVVASETQSLGDTAIVSQVLEISSESLSTIVRETAVWRKTTDAWRIHHLDVAALASGFTTGSFRNSGAVRVLKEKIGAVTSQLGVAQ